MLILQHADKHKHHKYAKPQHVQDETPEVRSRIAPTPFMYGGDFYGNRIRRAQLNKDKCQLEAGERHSRSRVDEQFQ